MQTLVLLSFGRRRHRGGVGSGDRVRVLVAGRIYNGITRLLASKHPSISVLQNSAVLSER